MFYWRYNFSSITDSQEELTKNNKYGLLSVETFGQNQHGKKVISFQCKIMFNI